METLKAYDNFPFRTVVLSNSVSFIIYISGLLLTLRAGWIVAAVYLTFILVLEYRLISSHCVNCFYYGRTCGFGKGRISSILFKRGDPAQFCRKALTWKDMVPDLLVTLFPMVIGIVYLIMKFSFSLMAIIAFLISSATAGNSYIRGSLTCKFCKQKELGCPAEKLFSKTDNSTDSSNLS
jgi:hypothetical protein